MSNEITEIIQLCENLSQSKRAEVADFARFLLSQESDEQWVRAIANPKPLPKLEAFLKESKREESKALDVDQL